MPWPIRSLHNPLISTSMNQFVIKTEYETYPGNNALKAVYTLMILSLADRLSKAYSEVLKTILQILDCEHFSADLPSNPCNPVSF